MPYRPPLLPLQEPEPEQTDGPPPRGHGGPRGRRTAPGFSPNFVLPFTSTLFPSLPSRNYRTSPSRCPARTLPPGAGHRRARFPGATSGNSADCSKPRIKHTPVFTDNGAATVLPRPILSPLPPCALPGGYVHPAGGGGPRPEDPRPAGAQPPRQSPRLATARRPDRYVPVQSTGTSSKRKQAGGHANGRR